MSNCDKIPTLALQFHSPTFGPEQILVCYNWLAPLKETLRTVTNRKGWVNVPLALKGEPPFSSFSTTVMLTFYQFKTCKSGL